MNDENDVRVPDQAAATSAQAQPVASGPRLRDRLWGLRALLAVALASVIIGGLGGAAIAKRGEHEDHGRFGGPGRFGPGQMRGQQPGRSPGQPFGQPPGQSPGQQNQQQAPASVPTPSASPTT